MVCQSLQLITMALEKSFQPLHFLLQFFIFLQLFSHIYLVTLLHYSPKNNVFPIVFDQLYHAFPLDKDFVHTVQLPLEILVLQIHKKQDQLKHPFLRGVKL